MTFQEKFMWASIITFALITTLSIVLIMIINRVIKNSQQMNQKKPPTDKP